MNFTGKAVITALLLALTACGAPDPAPALSNSASPSASPAVLSLTACLNHGVTPSPKPMPPPLPTAAADTGTAVMTIKTNLGVMEVDLDRSKVPCTAALLKQDRSFNGAECHRLTRLLQHFVECGDPDFGDHPYTVENLPPTRAPMSHPASCTGQLGNRTIVFKCPTALTQNLKPTADYEPATVAFAYGQLRFFYERTELSAIYTPLGRVRFGFDVIRTVVEGGVQDDGVDGKPRKRLVIESVEIR